MRRLPLFLFVCAAATAASFAGESTARDAFLGVWRGTSKCLNLKATPACRDEEVIYTVTAVAGASDRVLLHAEKLVNGKPEPMGDLEFTYNAAEQRWDSEMTNARFHALWSFTLRERKIDGSLVLLPERTPIRKVDVTKD